LRVRRLGFFEARFVDRAHPVPAGVAVALFAVAIGLARMRRDDFQQIKCCEAVLRNPVPEAVVAAGPDQPHVAPLYLFGGHRRAIVHVAKIVLLGLRKTRHIAVGALRLVHRSGLRLGGEREGHGRYRQGAHEECNSTRKNVFSHDRFLAQSVGSSGRRNYRSIGVQFKRGISRRLALLSLRRSPMRAIFKANFLLIEAIIHRAAAVVRRATGTQNYTLETQYN
jgi:hypothetical protein